MYFSVVPFLMQCNTTTLFFKMGKVIPKRKLWSAAQPRGPKRVKVEVKSTQTEASQCLIDGMTTEAYELMVKGRFLSLRANMVASPSLGGGCHIYHIYHISYCAETPSSTYWKEVAEERRKALYNVLQENEKVS